MRTVDALYTNTTSSIYHTKHVTVHPISTIKAYFYLSSYFTSILKDFLMFHLSSNLSFSFRHKWNMSNRNLKMWPKMCFGRCITTRIWRSENWFRMPLQSFHYKIWISGCGKSQIVSMCTVVYGNTDLRIRLINLFAFIYLYCKLGICKPCPVAPWHVTRLFFQPSWCAVHSTVKHDSYRGSEVALWPTDICDGTKQKSLSRVAAVLLLLSLDRRSE
jgi:hypothetical protein